MTSTLDPGFGLGPGSFVGWGLLPLFEQPDVGPPFLDLDFAITTELTLFNRSGCVCG